MDLSEYKVETEWSAVYDAVLNFSIRAFDGGEGVWEPLIEGAVRNGPCINWWLVEQDAVVHFCGPEGVDKLAKVFKDLFEEFEKENR